MRDETKYWLQFAEDNLNAAKVLAASNLYNPCLHNIQQSIEKTLKSIFIEKGKPLIKTHNILELNNLLNKMEVYLTISTDECEFLDSIYLPSKYPVGSSLPHFYPDKEICSKSILLADRVLAEVKQLLSTS